MNMSSIFYRYRLNLQDNTVVSVAKKLTNFNIISQYFQPETYDSESRS